MNTPKSVAWGWAAFTVAGVGGAIIGYNQWSSGKEARARERMELRKKQQAELEKINRNLATLREETKQLKQAADSTLIGTNKTGVGDGHHPESRT